MAQNYWNRIGYIAIEDDSGRMVRYGGMEDSLDFKFSGEKFGDINPKFTASILGLSAKTINSLAVWDISLSSKRKRRLQVFAGYSHQRLVTPIFDGWIMKTSVTTPPDMWLNFECMGCWNAIDAPDLNITLEDTLENIGRKIANLLGLNGFSWRAKRTSGNTNAKFSFTGPAAQIARRFSQSFNLQMINDNGILSVYDRFGWLNDVEMAEDVNMNTGMIGIPSVDMKGALVKTRLNTNADMFSWINLKSKFFSAADGYYYIMKVKHEGHFRGDEWFTELDTVRKVNK